MDRFNNIFVHPKDVGEASNLFLQLSEKIYSIQEKHVPGKSKVPDARRMGLMNCYQFITTNIFMMNIVNKVSKGILPPKVFTEIIDLEEGDLRKVMEDMFLMTKMSIVPLFQFQIENMLRNILLHLDPEASVVSYYKICEKLIHSITINDKEELITCLQIPAKIRNSLHSNGIYKRMSPKEPEIAKYYLEGVEFKFENGKGINCAGSGHIYLSFDKTLDIVDGILDSPEVSSIKTEIKDQWAWENKGLLV